MKIENCRRIFYMTVKDNDNGHTVKLCVISHQIIQTLSQFYPFSFLSCFLQITEIVFVFQHPNLLPSNMVLLLPLIWNRSAREKKKSPIHFHHAQATRLAHAKSRIGNTLFSGSAYIAVFRPPADLTVIDSLQRSAVLLSSQLNRLYHWIHTRNHETAELCTNCCHRDCSSCQSIAQFITRYTDVTLRYSGYCTLLV